MEGASGSHFQKNVNRMAWSSGWKGDEFY